MPAFSETPSRFIADYVVFTGRLRSLSRRDAQALVARLGGTPEDQVTARTTMLVIGDAGPAGDRPDEAPDAGSRKLRRAERLNREQPGRIRILSEDEFCRLAGVQPPADLKQQYYAATDIRAIYPRLRDVHLRYLQKWNLIRPVLSTHAERYYGFQDLAVIRQVAADLARGVPLGTAIRTVHAERAGQLSLDFRLDARPARVVRLRRPSPAAQPEPRERDPVEAERLFMAAAALDDGDPERREEAAAEYRRALIFDPDLVPGLVNLANIYYAQDRLSEAEALYSRALSLDPGVFEGHFNLGNVYHDRGQFEEARGAYERALALNPVYPDGHFYLAVTLEKLGRSQEARPHWRAYQRLAPDGEWAELAREFSE
jgi:tetratricopeptide (TPR) repeat protein